MHTKNRFFLLISILVFLMAGQIMAQSDETYTGDIENDRDEDDYTIELDEGDSVIITAIAPDGSDLDTYLTLLNEDGDEVATDDDSGEGTNPALIRVQLPEDGEYSIVIEHYSDGEEIEDDFEVTLFEVDVLDLDSGAQTVELGDEFQVDRMVFEAEEDTRYFVLIEADDTIDGTLYLDFLEEGDSFATTRMTVSGTDQALIIFEANDDGMVIIELDFFSFSGSNEFTIEIEAE